MSRSWAGGSTWAWRKTRAKVLARDGYRCQLGLPGCTGKATEVHHKQGREATGDDPEHLVAACQNCNLKVGDPRRHDPKPDPRRQW